MIRGSSATTLPTCVSRSFIGTVGAANATGTLIELFNADASGQPTGPVLATATPVGSGANAGTFSIQLPFSLLSGTTSLIAKAIDVVGNPGPGNSSVVTLTLVTVPSDYSGNLLDYNSNNNLPPPTPPVLAQSEAVLFSRDTSGKGLWFVQPTAPSNVPTWFASGTALGAATDIPLQGDFDGDGKTDLATYNFTTATWSFNDSSRGGSSFVFGTARYQPAGRRQLRRPRRHRIRSLRYHQQPGPLDDLHADRWAALGSVRSAG